MLDTMAPSSEDMASRAYFHNGHGQRVDTDPVIAEAIKQQHPDKFLAVSPGYQTNIIGYANAGHALCKPIEDKNSVIDSLSYHFYVPPVRRLDENGGGIADVVRWGKFAYAWGKWDYLVWVAEGCEGIYSKLSIFILGEEKGVNELLVAVGKWQSMLHGEIWVFDQGWWQKDAELWQSIQKSEWDDVILDQDMKEALANDVNRFFDSREQYDKLGVPWKRGVIFWGPPGNGKTISIKATMHNLYRRKEPIPTLYVRTTMGYAPPQYSITQIFRKARLEAPCYLVFEDLDSVVSDSVRSLFLNEIDGLASNDGIFIIGSTNHLDRLDPGIAKRPSRFDRKYYFPDPNNAQRIQYCRYWQEKLRDNDDVEFPDRLCEAVAEITDGFSFAYIQEAFVAALLVIAYGNEDKKGKRAERNYLELLSAEEAFYSAQISRGPGGLKDNLLWKELQKQIKLLREELGQENIKSTVEQEPSPSAYQDYELQLRLLELQNKKRLSMAKPSSVSDLLNAQAANINDTLNQQDLISPTTESTVRKAAYMPPHLREPKRAGVRPTNSLRQQAQQESERLRNSLTTKSAPDPSVKALPPSWPQLQTWCSPALEPSVNGGRPPQPLHLAAGLPGHYTANSGPLPRAWTMPSSDLSNASNGNYADDGTFSSQFSAMQLSPRVQHDIGSNLNGNAPAYADTNAHANVSTVPEDLGPPPPKFAVAGLVPEQRQALRQHHTQPQARMLYPYNGLCNYQPGLNLNNPFRGVQHAAQAENMLKWSDRQGPGQGPEPWSGPGPLWP